MDPVERLGRLLLEKGILTPEQLDACLKDHQTSVQQGNPRELSEIIVSRGYLDAQRMTRALETAKAPAPLRRKETRRAVAPRPRRLGWLLAAGGGLVALGIVVVVAVGRPEPPPVAETPVPVAAPPQPALPIQPEKPPPALVTGAPEDRRLQETFLDALSAAIRETPRDLPKLHLRTSSLDRVRLLDATRETLFVRHGGRARELPWAEVAPHQIADLSQLCLPRLQGEAGLGLVVFCLRNKLVLEATRADVALEGTPEGARSRKMMIDAGLAKAEERPAPPPPPKPVEAPVHVVPRPAPKDPFQEVLARWTYRPDWAAYGPDFARALAERGWEDLAFEITANLLRTPGLAPEGRAEALFAAASYRALAAARARDPEERLALLEAALGAFRDLDGPAALAARVGLHRTRAREFLRLGRRGAAQDELSAGLAILQQRIADAARSVLPPPEPGDAAALAAWRKSRDPALLARLDWAAFAIDGAEAAWELPGATGVLVPLLKRVEAFLEEHLASVPGAELAALEAATLLGRSLRLRALAASGEEGSDLRRRCYAELAAGSELLRSPAVRAHPSARAAAARSVLAEMKAREGRAALERGEAFLAALPEMRATDLGRAIRLEIARLDRSERGAKHLESLLRESPAGSWSEAAALELASEPGVMRDARALADRLYERGGDDLVRSVRLYRSIGDAPSRYRIALVYAALGRPFESAAALEDAAEGDAALLRYRSLREAAALTGERGALDRMLAGGAANPNSPRLPEIELEIARLAALRPVRPPPPDFRVEGPLAGVALSVPGAAFAPRSRSTADPDAGDAVLAALQWLSRHQAKDGSWNGQGYISECRKVKRYASGGNCTPNPGYEDFDGGVTGLALLAFLGAGYSHLSEEAHDGILFGEVVHKGLRRLVSTQDPEGCVGTRSAAKYMYNHGPGALALVEAYGFTKAPWLKGPAQKAVDFTVAAQNPGKGWRYSYKCGDNDSSVTGWQMSVLRAAELSGLTFPRTAYDGARAWFDEVTEDAYGRVGYTHKGTGKVFAPGLNEQFDHHETLSAIGVFSRIFIDRNKGDPRLAAACDLLKRDSPRWEGNSIDFYYWFMAANAFFQLEGASGSRWKPWHEDLKNALLRNQNTGSSGCKRGSWETIDRWSGEGGRVYATAINALTLETPYRYGAVFGTEKPKR